jgi:hypothetical protein
MYASSMSVHRYRSIQDKLRIDIFARKHGLTIENVEVALELKPENRKKYLKQLKEKQ